VRNPGGYASRGRTSRSLGDTSTLTRADPSSVKIRTSVLISTLGGLTFTLRLAEPRPPPPPLRSASVYLLRRVGPPRLAPSLPAMRRAVLALVARGVLCPSVYTTGGPWASLPLPALPALSTLHPSYTCGTFRVPA
jgi:hypothetical protein